MTTTPTPTVPNLPPDVKTQLVELLSKVPESEIDYTLTGGRHREWVEVPADGYSRIQSILALFAPDVAVKVEQRLDARYDKEQKKIEDRKKRNQARRAAARAARTALPV